MPTTASVEEADSLFMACVMLTTIDDVSLDVNLVVLLNTTDGTGLFDRDYIMMTSPPSLSSATAMNMDYQSLTDEEVIFLPGDTNGTERCANITIQEDLLVECEEDFNVTLVIQAEKSNLFLENSITTVSIIDSNGKLY